MWGYKNQTDVIRLAEGRKSKGMKTNANYILEAGRLDRIKI